MGEVRIKDSTGKGVFAKVTEDNELLTRAVTSSVPHKAALKGDDAVTGTPILVLNATTTPAVDSKVIYLRNDSDIPYVFSFNLNSWNGGDTNHDRVMYVDFFIETGTVLANNTLTPAFSLNQTITKDIPLTIEVWDGVDNGLTFTNGAPFSSTTLNPKGVTKIASPDTLILGRGKAISAALRGEEVGVGGIVIFGYFLTEKLS